MVEYNRDMYYEDPNPNGKPAVLLLHGLGADSASWSYQTPVLLSQGMRPIIPDIPGFGKSRYVNKRWSIPGVTVELAGLVTDLSATPLVLVGISMGGTLALQLALDFPQCIERLVLVNTFASLRPRRFSELSYLAIRFLRANLIGVKAQAEMVAWRIFPRSNQAELRKMLIESIHHSDPAVYRAAMRSLGLYNVTKKLGKIRNPTLVITGTEDSTVPLAAQADLAEKIPGAKQVFIPGGGHAVTVDQPERFNQVMLDFLLH